MIIAGLVLAGLAALVHVYIFVLESLTWTSPRTRATFGVASEADAETMRELAFNQGFYNLFLAIVTAAGIVLSIADLPVLGAVLVLVGSGSMAAAAIVLVSRSPAKLRAALVQGVLPLAAVVLVAIGFPGALAS